MSYCCSAGFGSLYDLGFLRQGAASTFTANLGCLGEVISSESLAAGLVSAKVS